VRSLVRLAALWLGCGSAALWLGCGGASIGLEPPGTDRIVEPPLSAGCNPLGGGPGEDCLLPFPSDVFTRPDATSATGRRIELSAAALPATRKGKRLDPQPFSRRDGFSPATPILAHFPRAFGPIDPMLLPGPGRIDETLSDKSPVQLLRFDTGERVPISAELDHNASDGERQAIVIYPQLRLREKTRYVVALRGLRTMSATGAVKELQPLTGFKALRDGKLQPGSARDRLRPRYAEIFSLLEKQGVPRGELQLAWDFTTASDEPITGRMVRMRDQAFGYKPSGDMPPPPFSVQKSTDKPREFLYRQVIGTLAVPSFLKSDADGRLLLGSDGEPVVRGWGQFPLVIHIPACAERSMVSLPVMIFGHGLFGDALGEMDSGYEREIANRLCMIQIGTNWIGLSEAERAYAAGEIMADFNNFVQLTDRLQQAHVNFLFLAHVIRSGALERLPELQIGGRIVVDSKRVSYYGISNGAVQGVLQLALSPELARGCLNVGGGFWSHMIWRSADFADFGALLASSYPDPLDRQVLVALTQWHWDYTDPATYAPHILRDFLPGSGPPKPLLYQEGVGDAQVPNMATRALMRTMGLSLLNQPVEAVFGIGQVSGPVRSAYVQFDVGVSPRPGADNTPPADNKVHEAIRRLEAARLQLQSFLRDEGDVLDTCFGKPCIFM
jgi:hypothetical protein